ncbi:MAG: hypothetical protein WDA08_11745 [Weeksellaceae bacterium]
MSSFHLYLGFDSAQPPVLVIERCVLRSLNTDEVCERSSRSEPMIKPLPSVP